MDHKLVIPNHILLEEVATLLQEGRDVTLSPKGTSMLPFIKEGRDSVILRRLPDVEEGDIVLARLDNRYVLHRVLSANHNRLTLMGDGNLDITETCTKDDVLGTVIGVVRKDKSKKPSKGVLWKYLLPFRRILLGIYRRITP